MGAEAPLHFQNNETTLDRACLCDIVEILFGKLPDGCRQSIGFVYLSPGKM